MCLVCAAVRVPKNSSRDTSQVINPLFMLSRNIKKVFLVVRHGLADGIHEKDEMGCFISGACTPSGSCPPPTLQHCPALSMLSQGPLAATTTGTLSCEITVTSDTTRVVISYW